MGDVRSTSFLPNQQGFLIVFNPHLFTVEPSNSFPLYYRQKRDKVASVVGANCRQNENEKEAPPIVTSFCSHPLSICPTIYVTGREK